MLFDSFLVNIGPQHPSTHGVLRLVALMSGELVKWLDIEIGLLHRGTEKLLEFTAMNQIVGYFDRMDYMSIVLQELALIQALEKSIGGITSLYVGLIRTCLGELFRILNHSLNITTTAIDLGLFTTML
jgi:NADH:ubiquinone oxidoreductase subunit D